MSKQRHVCAVLVCGVKTYQPSTVSVFDTYAVTVRMRFLCGHKNGIWIVLQLSFVSPTEVNTAGLAVLISSVCLSGCSSSVTSESLSRLEQNVRTRRCATATLWLQQL